MFQALPTFPLCLLQIPSHIEFNARVELFKPREYGDVNNGGRRVRAHVGRQLSLVTAFPIQNGAMMKFYRTDVVQ